MAIRRPEGAALLVAGFGAPNAPAALDASAVHTLGQIGEALLATGAAWQIRRLTATAGERYAADRATLKHHLDELIAEPVRAAVVVLLGTIVEVQGMPALVTGAQAREYPEDATLPLAWIRDRLLASKAEHLVMAVSARGEGTATGWLGALGTHRGQHVIAVDAPDDGHPVIDALLTGLCGDALDPRTGTVTMSSLCDHVRKHVPRAMLQGSTASETLAQPPPLAGFWDVRRSQLANRGARTRAPGEPEDLTGIVLPGRFRIDSVVARGTFGTVYRARQLAVERDVAVKVLHANIDPSSEDGRLFVHEIRSVGRIDHTNVVRIHQADITQDGRLFFAMELLDGRDLQTVGAEGVLPRERAVGLVRQLLAGLGAAHQSGLVHADVKPANAIVIKHAAPATGSSRPPSESDDAERLVLVDFGLSRLRAPDRPAESAGGTPAYMAPEQLHEGRVDARSDLYSAALVLVFLLTGWRRPNAYTLEPSLDTIVDADLRAVIARALDKDPTKRYQTARELAAALIGTKPTSATATQPTPILPFHHLAALTETDRGRLHGRESDLAVLTEHVLFRRSLVYTAPSGTGKTSVLRAGLLPRLEALGVHAIYQRCRGKPTAALADAIAAGSTSIAEAVATWHKQRGGKLVIVLDQLEAALGDPDFVPSVLAFDRWPAGADVSVVLSIREDYLARLVARTQELEPGMPIVRLPPLSPEGARAAIMAPLTEGRLAIEPELLDALLEDLQRAATAIGPEMGWGGARAVYPPHLQLACTVLYEALEPGEATLTLARYRRLGGFDAIVGEHLERVLDTELADGRDVIARDLFVALVTAAHERAVRPESELLAMVGTKHEPQQVTAVLEILRSRGLLVRVRGNDEPGWELVHDSLVPRVLAWIDARDLARRRAIELVRYHLRRSQPEAPSLLGRAELRELKAHAGAIVELDVEWKERATDNAWTPQRLVGRSRQVLRRRTAVLATIVCAALGVGSVGMYRSRREEARAQEEARLKSLDLGKLTLKLQPFDWDPVSRTARPATPRLADFAWELRSPEPNTPDQPGTAYEPAWVVRGTPRVEGNALVENIEAHGGRSFLVVARSGCKPSVVPIRHLPGYAQRGLEPVVEIRVPTCQATRADMREVPAGTFIYGGQGQPPVSAQTPPEKRMHLPAFQIDRTEVTNAAFGVFSSMAQLTGIAPPVYPDPGMDHFRNAMKPRVPVTGIDWVDARAYCHYLGKDLPSTEQWTKALRGGEQLDGAPNPMPRRNYPWGIEVNPAPARLRDTGTGAAEVATHLGDVSPYGVLDLAGNVTELTRSSTNPPGMRIARGGNWEEATPAVFNAIENWRAERQRMYSIGFRCASID